MAKKKQNIAMGNDSQELMIITTEGIVIRIRERDISTLGRNTSGVKLINIDAEGGVHVSSIAPVAESQEESGEEAVPEETEGVDGSDTAGEASNETDAFEEKTDETVPENESVPADDSLKRLLDAAERDQEE